MATEKKQPIVKHKATAKRTATDSQSFDIIPASRVMPSASSRPVITSNSPQQSDNTLTPGAPTIQARRRKIVQPSDDLLSGDTAPSDMEMPKLPALPIDEPTEKPTDNDLTDKAAEDMQAQMVTEPAAAPTAETNALSNDDIENEVARALAGSDDGTAPADHPEPVSEEAAETVAKPEPDNEPNPLATAKEDTAAATPAAEKAAPAADSSAPAPDAKPAADDSSVSAVLSGDETASTQEHSQALKDAMQDLDENGIHHHELYGGKPVIVVHKAHTSRSILVGLLWFVICLALALALVDVLLDAKLITVPYDLPITNFF